MPTPQQLILDWTTPALPAFDNFLPGRNAEVIGHLRSLAAGTLAMPSVLVWGAPGSGRSHLLAATLEQARTAGRVARRVELGVDEAVVGDDPGGVASDDVAARDTPPADVPLRGMPPGAGAERDALYGIDDVDGLDADGQGRLFTLYNACREVGAQLLLTAGVPAARLPVRDDLRTRIGAGLILEVMPLADADKPVALAAYARDQGFALGDDVIAYLLTRGRRDMSALLANLRALDRYSLAMKRPVTVPLVRELLGSMPVEAPVEAPVGDGR